MAGPLSPEYPDVSVPATVEMTPAGVTLRTRWLAPSAINKLPAASNARTVMLEQNGTDAFTFEPRTRFPQRTGRIDPRGETVERRATEHILNLDDPMGD